MSGTPLRSCSSTHRSYQNTRKSRTTPSKIDRLRPLDRTAPPFPASLTRIQVDLINRSISQCKEVRIATATTDLPTCGKTTLWSLTWLLCGAETHLFGIPLSRAVAPVSFPFAASPWISQLQQSKPVSFVNLQNAVGVSRYNTCIHLRLLRPLGKGKGSTRCLMAQ